MPGSPKRDNSSIIFSDLMAKVGYLMLYWSRLEQALNDEIGRLGTELGIGEGLVRGGIQERLDQWTGLVGRSSADLHIHLVAEQ